MKQFDIHNVDPEMLDLVKEFPKIFLEPSEDVLYWVKKDEVPEEDVVNLRYGFEHGNGWKEIVRGFCKEIQEYCDKLNDSGFNVQYKACIMKEKFGQFTPQGDIVGDIPPSFMKEYWRITSKWEQASTLVCEVTGKEGKLVTTDSGWWRTLCEEEMGERFKPIE